MPNAAPTQLLLQVTRRLFMALVVMFIAALALMTAAAMSDFKKVVPPIVVAAGFIGGFVGLQRRLKDLTVSDLELIAGSWVYTSLSPLVGGVLAFLLYVLFLSELVSGQLFPTFVPDNPTGGTVGFASVFEQHGKAYQDYAKLVFWSFVAGFSERFVTDVISRFEGAAVKSLPQSTMAAEPSAPADRPDAAGR